MTHDVIAKSGTWFSYNETRMGQGRANSRTFLLENPDIYEEIEIRLREKLGLAEESGDNEEPVGEEAKKSPEKKGKKGAASAS